MTSALLLSLVIPTCGATITFSDMPDRIGNYINGQITIDTRISQEDRGWTIHHELGHHYYRLFSNNWSARRHGFGKAPFITDYAGLRTDDSNVLVSEDIAESFAHKLNGGTLPLKKNRYIRRLIAKGKKCDL